MLERSSGTEIPCKQFFNAQLTISQCAAHHLGEAGGGVVMQTHCVRRGAVRKVRQAIRDLGEHCDSLMRTMAGPVFIRALSVRQFVFNPRLFLTTPPNAKLFRFRWRQCDRRSGIRRFQEDDMELSGRQCSDRVGPHARLNQAAENSTPRNRFAAARSIDVGPRLDAFPKGYSPVNCEAMAIASDISSS